MCERLVVVRNHSNKLVNYTFCYDTLHALDVTSSLSLLHRPFTKNYNGENVCISTLKLKYVLDNPSSENILCNSCFVVSGTQMSYGNSYLIN